MPLKGGLAFGLGKAGVAGKPKARSLAAFQAESDDEDTSQPKRQRTDANNLSVSVAPAAPEDPDVLKAAIKLAEFVAKNGRHFEDVTRQRNPEGGPFKFLFDTSSSTYKWYEQQISKFMGGAEASTQPPPALQRSGPVHAPKQEPSAAVKVEVKQEYSAGQGPQGWQQGAPGQQGAPWQQQHVPGQQQGAPWQQAGPSQQDAQWQQGPHLQPAPGPLAASPAAPAAVVAAPGSSGHRSRFSEAAPGALARVGKQDSEVDPVAAMERYAQMAAEKESRAEAEREQKVALLNENAYDRRTVKAVYKQDGTRGHHMQDFIPQEELAKVLAKSGNAADQAQAAQLEQQSRIQADNVGHKCAPQLICQRATCLQAAAPTCCISLGPQMAPPLSCSGLCTQSCSVALASACNSGGVPAARLLQAGGAVTDTRGASLPCRLLSKMGWKEGSGLGASATGMAAPIAASGASSEKRGLGAEQHGQINEDDDAFEQYRKRMMLGYKHRPNPLGNPRKSYY